MKCNGRTISNLVQALSFIFSLAVTKYIQIFMPYCSVYLKVYKHETSDN